MLRDIEQTPTEVVNVEQIKERKYFDPILSPDAATITSETISSNEIPPNNPEQSCYQFPDHERILIGSIRHMLHSVVQVVPYGVLG